MSAIAASNHAARMDAIYGVQRHLYDLTRKYYLLGRDRLIAGLNAGPDTHVLEVGCGTGRNLVAAARRWPEADFTGLDISSAMLNTAHRSVERADLSSRIALVEADACDFTSNPMMMRRFYDRIFMSYTLSMIPGWELAIEEAVGVLAPRGSLHIVDFGQQEGLPCWFRSMLFAWLRKFHVSPRADMAAVLGDLAARNGMRLVFRPLYRGYAWEAVLTSEG